MRLIIIFFLFFGCGCDRNIPTTTNIEEPLISTASLIGSWKPIDVRGEITSQTPQEKAETERVTSKINGKDVTVVTNVVTQEKIDQMKKKIKDKEILMSFFADGTMTGKEDGKITGKMKWRLEKNLLLMRDESCRREEMVSLVQFEGENLTTQTDDGLILIWTPIKDEK